MRLQVSNLRSDERSTTGRMALPFLSKEHEPGGDRNENQSMSHSSFCARTSGSTGASLGTSWALTLMYLSVSTPFSKGILRWGDAIEGIGDAVALAQSLSQFLCLSTNSEALVRWLLERPRTLKSCKRNYLFEGSIGKRRRVQGSVYKSVKRQLVLDAFAGTVPSPMELEA